MSMKGKYADSQYTVGLYSDHIHIGGGGGGDDKYEWMNEEEAAAKTCPTHVPFLSYFLSHDHTYKAAELKSCLLWQ